MKITFDQVSSNYSYPLTTAEVRAALNVLSKDLTSNIRAIRFGCNQATTQEGRLVTRGSGYEIRINFCLDSNKSRMLSDSNSYLKYVIELGGKVDLESASITWPESSSKRYALFILFHELKHIEYNSNRENPRLTGKSSLSEESYCDEEALRLVEAYKF